MMSIGVIGADSDTDDADDGYTGPRKYHSIKISKCVSTITSK